MLVHLLTYLFAYTVGLGRIKSAISPKRLKIERKLLYNGQVVHRLSIAAKMYDLEWPLSEIEVIDSLNAAKMTKFSLVMTPTPRRMVLCITSIRPTYSRVRSLRLLTYLHSWFCAYKTVNISKTVEDRAKVTINGRIKSYTGFRCMTMTFEWLLSKIQGHCFFKCRNTRNTA